MKPDVARIIRAKSEEYPEDWNSVSLNDILEECKEKNRGNSEYPVFSISNIKGFVLSDEFFKKRVYSKEVSAYKLVEKEYFAYNPYRVNIGSIGLFDADIKGLVSPAYVVFRITDTLSLFPQFLLLILKSSQYMSEIKRISMSRGSVRRSLSFRDLCDFKIPLPFIKEQQKIVSVLSVIQDSKEKTENIISALKELKKSMMKHLFTYGPVFIEETEKVPLKETEIGMIPEHWNLIELGEIVCDGPQNGIYKPQSLYGKGTQIVRIDDYDNEGEIISAAKNCVSLSFAEESKYGLKLNDILINRVNSLSHLGKAALIGQITAPAVFESNMMRIRVNSDFVIPEYVFRFLCTPTARNQLRAKAKRAVAQSSVNQGDIKTLLMPLPKISEQLKCVEIMSFIEKRVYSEESKKNSFDSLFKTLLSLLMTGKLRVKDLDIPI